MKEDRSPRGTPVALRGEDGEARWWFGALAVIKATAKDTGGQLAVVEVTEPPGAVAPLHVHHREDEVGGTTFEATGGDFAFGPRDIPHRYEVADTGCRLLFMLTPAGFEDLLVKMSEPAASRTLPPAPAA